MRCIHSRNAHLFSVKRNQAGSVRFLGKVYVMWRRSTKRTLVKYQANHLAVEQLQNRGFLNTAHHCIECDQRRIKQRVRVMQTF